MSACVTLEISIGENFEEDKRVVDGSEIIDYRLSRFACYLSSVNADISKPRVAEAQAYFLTLAEAFRKYIHGPDNVHRVLIREEVSQHEKSLNRTASEAGVENYAFFRNKGYIGMYNMGLSQLKKYKDHTGRQPLLDFMNKTELAANLFRITQTEDKISNENIIGQRNLENTAYTVGKKVRKTMQEISGTHPEDIPLAKNIRLAAI